MLTGCAMAARVSASIERSATSSPSFLSRHNRERIDCPAASPSRISSTEIRNPQAAHVLGRPKTVEELACVQTGSMAQLGQLQRRKERSATMHNATLRLGKYFRQGIGLLTQCQVSVGLAFWGDPGPAQFHQR